MIHKQSEIQKPMNLICCVVAQEHFSRVTNDQEKLTEEKETPVLQQCETGAPEVALPVPWHQIREGSRDRTQVRDEKTEEMMGGVLGAGNDRGQEQMLVGARAEDASRVCSALAGRNQAHGQEKNSKTHERNQVTEQKFSLAEAIEGTAPALGAQTRKRTERLYAPNDFWQRQKLGGGSCECTKSPTGEFRQNAQR
jgi:hypothetical protein